MPELAKWNTIPPMRQVAATASGKTTGGTVVMPLSQAMADPTPLLKTHSSVPLSSQLPPKP